MDILVRLPDEDYQETLTKIMLACRGHKVTELPIGHGRLIDMDKYESIRKPRGISDDGWDNCAEAKAIHAAETIIEADKAESEDT